MPARAAVRRPPVVVLTKLPVAIEVTERLVVVALVVVELVIARFEIVEEAVTYSPLVVVGARAPNELTEKSRN